jgi:adenylate cyclase
VLGSEKRIARRFGEKYEEYLLEPRYADMFRAGNEAMERFSDGDDDGGKSLNDALGSWNTPSDQHDPDAPIAVMFTDIVGSTALNQTHGDAVAQKIVHTHNAVVREALQRHAGIEVKHTGDGIMASFKNISNAVKSAVAMQKALVQHNAKKPDIPLHIKIGVNAGTPIAEDGDLFGTTVQLAARICDKAGAGEICATNLVKEFSQGSGAEFQSMGDFELKGVNEATTIYQVTAPGMAKVKAA